MYRRTFLASALSLTGASGGITLRAAFGARLPATIRITGLPHAASEHPWFEVRAYACANPNRLEALHQRFMKAGLLAHADIHPAMFESGRRLKYLIPFKSLEHRNQAWTLLDADSEWRRFRIEGEPVTVSEVTIYQNVGRVILSAARRF